VERLSPNVGIEAANVARSHGKCTAGRVDVPESGVKVRRRKMKNKAGPSQARLIDDLGSKSGAYFAEAKAMSGLSG
jgi:hypothetical protein